MKSDHLLTRLLFVIGITVLSMGYAPDQSYASSVEKAVMPLPASLRESATIVTFDAAWNRKVLRQGTSDLVCVAEAPFMGAQYSVCQHQSAEAFWVFGMQLRAQGKTGKEMNDIRIATMREGQLEIPQAGTARYFLIGRNPEVLFPLMIISLPDATGASTGLPTEPTAYRPWLMHAGTPSAHIMMPGD